MKDFEELLNNIIEDKGGTPEAYKSLLHQIAYHESAGTLDPTIKQYGGGPGRGKYQFEGKDGSNRILTSAVRTKNYYKHKGLKVPEFVQSIINKGTEDASKLTSEQQDILALADLRMKGGLDLKDYISGKLSVQDLWADHWWAGSKDKRESHIKSFNNSLNKLQNNVLSNNTLKKNNLNLNEKDITRVQDNTRVATNSYNKIPQQHLQSNNIKPDIFNTGLTDFLESYISSNDKLNEFNEGGTHEQNPYGGIPQGMGSNGKPNTVEENETSFELSDGKYIFSNRITL